MTQKIFTIGADNSLTEMKRAGFENEDLFQKLLADHSAVLGGDDDKAPLLITREISVPDSLDGTARWSLDHLYIDPSGVPILVEVKRASDTRIRREVVGQMLDYAANASVYWRIDTIVDEFTATCRAKGMDPDSVLSEFIPEGTGPDAFWKSVEANLRSGRVRLLFVADEVPTELKRIVEFLNEQMRPAEVLAIEVAHFSDASGRRVLLPTQIGRTERAVATKATTSVKPPISVEEWMAMLAAETSPEKVAAVRQVIDWHLGEGGEVVVTNSQDSLALKLTGNDGKAVWPLFVRRSTGGQLQLALIYLRTRPGLADPAERQAALDRFRAIPGGNIQSTGNLQGWPTMDADKLLNQQTWREFKEFSRWLYGLARKA